MIGDDITAARLGVGHNGLRARGGLFISYLALRVAIGSRCPMFLLNSLLLALPRKRFIPSPSSKSINLPCPTGLLFHLSFSPFISAKATSYTFPFPIDCCANAIPAAADPVSLARIISTPKTWQSTRQLFPANSRANPKVRCFSFFSFFLFELLSETTSRSVEEGEIPTCYRPNVFFEHSFSFLSPPPPAVHNSPETLPTISSGKLQRRGLL